MKYFINELRPPDLIQYGYRAWFCRSDMVNCVTDKASIVRVKEVVDYCTNDSAFSKDLQSALIITLLK